jgi:lipid-A-disaccharide synthase
MPRVLISCGEASGDLYAGALTRELRALDPQAQVFGFGGAHLASAGADLLDDYRDYTVTGLAEALRVLPRSYALYRRLLREVRVRRPDVFVPIDFPDFNFRLAAAVKRLGVPVVYYVSPQLWAWRPGRLRAMKAFVDRVLPIFPFESSIYHEAGIPVEFVGHPLVDLARAPTDRGTFLRGHDLDPNKPTVAVLPGSRPNEVRAILPGLVGASSIVMEAVPEAQFVLARAPHVDLSLFAPATDSRAHGGLRMVLVDSQPDQVLASADVVLTASGTATVQTALHERPMVIVYRVSPLSYRLGRRLVKVDTFGMVNLVAGRRVVPELIQDAFTPAAVAREAIRYLTDPVAAERTRSDLRDVKARLGAPGASRRAAASVLRAAKRPRTVQGS